MWTDPPKNHYPYEKTWKGWNFLEMVGGEQKPSSYLGKQRRPWIEKPRGPVHGLRRRTRPD